MEARNLELEDDKYGTSTTECLVEICEEHGFDHASFIHVDRERNLIAGFSTLPEEWKEVYVRERLWDVDPVIKFGCQMIRPFCWSELQVDVKTRAFFERASRAGLGEHGLTVPTVGPFGEKGMLSVAGRMNETLWKKLIVKAKPKLQRQSQLLHLSTLPKVSRNPLIQKDALSSEELSVLKYVAAGMESSQIALYMGKTSQSIRIFQDSMLTKLRCRTLSQAIAQSIKQGIISPSVCFGEPISEIVCSSTGSLLGSIVRLSDQKPQVLKAQVSFQYPSHVLCEFTPPMGISELAKELELDLPVLLSSLGLGKDQLVHIRSVESIDSTDEHLKGWNTYH